MLKAMGRYVRALFYLVTGRIDAARKTLSENPYVIEATFDQVISDKKHTLEQYSNALAGLIVQEETKRQKLTELVSEIQRYEKLKAGSAAMAKQLVAKYNGDGEKVKNDVEYMKCQSAFKDFSTTLEEKSKRADELESDLENLTKKVEQNKVNMQGLQRDINKIKEEKSETITDVLWAKQEKEINDQINGISVDRTNQELQQLRQVRQEAKAQAALSREMAGLNTSSEEQAFLDYAASSQSNDEFDRLIGLNKSVNVEVLSVDGNEVKK